MKTTCISVLICLLLIANISAQQTGILKDKRDKKKYTTVQIDDLIFMAQNLAYKPSFGLFWNGFENEDSLQIYGYLYDWKTAQSVCPSGWHLPSNTEWKTIIDYWAGQKKAGMYLKEAGCTHWKENKNGNNKSGFTGFPSGYFIQENNTFSKPSTNASWWSSTGASEIDAFVFSIYSYNDMAFIATTSKTNGYPVRCVKNK